MSGLARPSAILKWLRRAAGRNRRSFTSFAGNNLNYTAVALLFMLDPAGAGLLLLIMGVIVLLPLSSDPLQAIPRVRFLLWPLERTERRWLRLISPWLNPMTWIVLGLAIWKRASWGIGVLGAGVLVTGFVVSAAGQGARSMWRWLPRFPSPLNQLIRKNLREMLSTLDFCCGALISLAGLGWRAAGLLPPEAFFPLTIVAMLAISTIALTLFGLDGSAGMRRYRLMPAHGWQLLLAKDVAFLAIALVISLPLCVPGAMGAAFVALAIGHRTSLRSPRAQVRWRFQTGPSFGDAIGQIIPTIMAGAAVVYSSPLFLIPCLAAWAGSLWWFGRELDN